MQKEFNITGLCRPAKHYMADISGKLAQVYRLVEKGAYFVINRPRQYGKTTMLYSIADLLQKNKEYLVFNISFEGVSTEVFATEAAFSPIFVKLLAQSLRNTEPELSESLLGLSPSIQNLNQLSDFITNFTEEFNKKVVLLIDEVDKSSNNELFIGFLGVLRNKYLNQDFARTFHSIILAGVHDVKTLKLKLRPEAEQKYNSPWNIATEFTVDMNLQPAEIIPMLEDYAQEHNMTLDASAIAERLFYFTSGYPFLVSKLCKTIDEQILPSKSVSSWTPDVVDLATSMIVKETNTNFDSLIKNLENYPDLYDLVYKKLVDIEYQSYSIHDPTVSLGLMYGVLKNGQGISIHNRIYEEVIYAYMTSKATSKVMLGAYNVPQNFRLPNQRLNMEAVLLKFQAFMKEQYSKKDTEFLERNGRLVFLAFIKPIINGSGYDFKEPQISEERRLDVVITYYQHKYITELKVWRGAKVHAEGLSQLADYLDRQNQSEGYLLIFDHSKKKTWKSAWEMVKGKKVFVVWV